MSILEIIKQQTPCLFPYTVSWTLLSSPLWSAVRREDVDFVVAPSHVKNHRDTQIRTGPNHLFRIAVYYRVPIQVVPNVPLIQKFRFIMKPMY